jgi:hypothetical protein
VSCNGRDDSFDARKTESAARSIDREQRKLLDLHYADRICPETFAAEEARPTRQLHALNARRNHAAETGTERNDLRTQFDDVAALPRSWPHWPKSAYAALVRNQACRRGDLNPHPLAGTRPST